MLILLTLSGKIKLRFYCKINWQGLANRLQGKKTKVLWAKSELLLIAALFWIFYVEETIVPADKKVRNERKERWLNTSKKAKFKSLIL